MHKSTQKSIIRQWQRYYASIGLPEDIYNTYIWYASGLMANDAVVIFDFEHLCKLLGLEPNYVASIIYRPERHYREFKIPKRLGGIRTITAPYPALKEVQRWINKNILEKQQVHKNAHGFTPKRSIFTNVSEHINGKMMLKMDMKDFFPSIGKNRVVQVFRTIGYEKHVAYFLASICCSYDCLPQGAPTSPMLSNIIARHMDNRLSAMARQFNISYSRYADDMTFSGNQISSKFIEYVERIILDCGFENNKQKTRLYKEHGNKILTGISLRDGHMRLPRNRRRELSKEIHYILKYGVDSHLLRMKNKRINYVQSMLGQINFWLQIEPNNQLAQKAKDYLKDVFKSQIRIND